MAKPPTQLAAWRKFRGLTMMELAEKAALPTALITNLEAGVRGYDQDTLEALANALNCSPSQLISEPPPEQYAAVAPWVHPDQPAGHYLREWRLDRNLTLQDLAQLAGMTHTTVSRLERGLIPYSQRSLERLAAALHTDPASIILVPPRVGSTLHVLLSMSAEKRAQLGEIALILSRGDGNGSDVSETEPNKRRGHTTAQPTSKSPALLPGAHSSALKQKLARLRRLRER